MAQMLLLNGPNLNLLGTREPGVYGSTTLPEIEQALTASASTLGHSLSAFQSNSEAELVDRIQTAGKDTAFILFNPGAFTHTSLALRDAILAVDIPFIEIHISNVHAREEFRQQSYFSDVALGTIIGLGAQGYGLALQAAHEYLQGNIGSESGKGD
jgi:3-dehydroquinate dehydratase-2